MKLKKLLSVFLALAMLFGVCSVPVFADGSVARIGSTDYESLADAIAAVPTDGTKTTITMIADEELTSGVTVAANKNIVLDLNGFTVSESLSQSGTTALITNRGTLTIKDSTDTNADGTGTGKITYFNGLPDPAAIPGYASNTICNNGTLTIESGLIENRTNGGYAAYTVDNQTNGNLYVPVFTMNGGRLYNNYTDAVRMFLNSDSKLNKVVINGGILDSDKESGRVIVVHNPNGKVNKGELDITDGIINGKINAWSAANAGGVEDRFSDEQYAEISINISGGKIRALSFTEMANETLRAQALRVTGGKYKENPSAYVSTGYESVAISEDPYFFQVVPVAAKVARIGSTDYESLAEAIAAVPTDGTETTIVMLDDSAETDVITITANKNIVLDLNGHTVSYTTDASNKSVYFITNKGTLTVKDSETNGNIVFTADPYNNTYAKETVTVYNLGGTLNLLSGKITNASGGGLAYAVNNSSNAWGTGDDKDSVFNMSGGVISAPHGDAALRVYQNCSKSPTPISHNTVNITGGTILDTGIFLDSYIYQPDANTTGVHIVTSVNISGGEIHGLIDLKLRHPFNTSLNITGGTFVDCQMRVRKYSEWNDVVSEPTEPIVTISGGRFSFVDAAHMFNVSSAWTATSSWSTYKAPYEVTGGKFNLDPTFVADGYEAVPNTDDDSADYGYKIGTAAVYVAQIGDVKYESLAEAIAAAQDDDVVTLLKDLSVDSVVFIPKSITLNGANHTLTTTANRAIRVNQSNVTVTIRNLTIAGNTERAVQVDSDKDHVTLTLDHVTAAATMYTVNICGDVDDLVLNVTGCDLTGWGVINLWGNNGTVNVSGSALTGINNKTYNAEGWNDFGVIILEGDTTGQTDEHSSAYTVTVTNCEINAVSTTGNKQYVLLHNNPSAYNNLALDGCTITLGNENCHFYLDQSVQSATKIRATYMAGTLDVPTLPDGYLYVPVADNYKLIAQAVAVIGETPYASLKDAVEAATAGATIELIADDEVSLTSGGEIVINKSLTINGNDYTIYGTPDQTGSNDIFITGSGTVTINGLNVEGFGYNHATDAGHAPIYVSTNFTGTVNLIGVSVSKFNRGGIFLYGGNFHVEGCDIDCANSRSGAFTKGIEIKGSASGTISDTDIYNMERSSTTYSTAGIEIYGNGSIVVDNCTISSNVDTHTTTKGTYGIISSRVGAHDPSGGALQVEDTVIDVTNAALSVTDSDDYGPVNNYSIEVTDCTFTNYIATWSATSTVTINSGNFAEDVYADAGTIIIHGGNFINFAPDTDTGSIVIDGGKFSADPSTYVASGYEAAAINEDPYFFQVGKVIAGNLVEQTEPEQITDGYDSTYTVTKTVVDEGNNNQVIATGNTLTVNVKVEDENAIPENKEIASAENTAEQITGNLKMDKVLDSVVDAVESETNNNDTINVQIQVVRDVPEIQNDTITYEVHPIALIYLNDDEEPAKTVTISNDALADNAVFTVTLPVPNELAAAATSSNHLIKVVHRSADYPAETKHFPLQGTYDHYYVQFTVTHFSEFELAIDELAGDPAFRWGAALILEDMVAINLHVWELKDRYGNVEADPSRFTVKYTFRGETKEVALTGTDNNVIVAKVAAKELVDEVTIELYYDGVLLESKTYSARTYCETKINNPGDDLKPEELKTLCSALLEYGAAAQVRFNYKTEDLANKNIEHAALSDVPAYPHTKNGDLTLSASLSLKENTQINVYFLPAAGCDSHDYTATVGGQPVTITDSGSYCYIAIPGIAAKNLGAFVTVVITRTATDESTTLQYSPLTWANRMQGTVTTEVEYYVARTLYAYYLAAAAYFAN